MNRLLIASLAVLLTASLARANSAAALDTDLARVDLVDVPAHRAFEWLGAAAGFNLVINWDQLEAVGYDRYAPVTVRLKGVKAKTVLRLMLSDVFHEGQVLAEVEPAFVRIRTKAAANRDVVVKTYSVADLLFTPEPYNDPPELSLDQIVAGSDNSGSIFDKLNADKSVGLSRQERVDQIADAIRNNIEPDIWEANGGQDGRISYSNGQLIVRAPEYVHQRIGLPTVVSRRSAPLPAVSQMTTYRTTTGQLRATSSTMRAPRWGAYKHLRGNPISGIDRFTDY
jgi:hypothetical protein